MTQCDGGSPKKPEKKACAAEPQSSCCSSEKKASQSVETDGCPISWFSQDVEHCLSYLKQAKQSGAKVVGIMCEYTPRELIIAAGGIPVCLCGGSQTMVEHAEQELPANLCPLIKSTFGYSLKQANPFLEMADLLVAETTCDGKKKMYELLERRHPMHVLELPQKPDDAEAFQHWVAELRRLKTVLELRFDTTITEEKLRTAVRQMNRERKLRRDLAGLLKQDPPPLTGSELLEMKSLVSCMPDDFVQYERALELLPKRTLPDSSTKAVRVLLTGVPLPHGAERVMTIIEESGGLVVCQENCTGLKPILEDVDESAPDLLEALAEKYYHLPCSVMTHNKARLELLEELIEQYHADCVIELIWQACITYSIESRLVEELAKKAGRPYLRIETDYSPSDSARIALRVQALFETVGSRKQVSGQDL